MTETDFSVARLARKWCPHHVDPNRAALYPEIPCECGHLAAAIRAALEEAEKFPTQMRDALITDGQILANAAAALLDAIRAALLDAIRALLVEYPLKDSTLKGPLDEVGAYMLLRDHVAWLCRDHQRLARIRGQR